MSDVAVRVEGLSKRYRIELLRKRNTTLREHLTDWAGSLFRNGAKARSTGEFWALDDISFEIPRGQVVGIIGRNGAGKSTLLKILARITTPTRGWADLHGRVSSLLEVGTGFHPELTGRENIFLNGAVLGMSRAEVRRKLDEIVAFAEVERFLDTPVKRYSSGMYVRLAFGVAAHLDPEILLVDEVLAVGDAAFQRKCLGRMGNATREGRTVFFVSHNMAAIKHLCERSILLERGKVAFDGATAKCIHAYLGSGAESARGGAPLAVSKDESVSIAELAVVDDQGAALEFIQSGQSVHFRMIIKTTRDLDNVIVTIGIDDVWGARLCLLGSMLVGKSLSIRAPETCITCSVPNFPLVPGEYTLSPEIYRLPDLPHWIIWAPNALKINVESGDFFGSGVMLRDDWVGSVWLKQSWGAA